VVQFVMNDKEGSGNVSLEGAMQILYLRYGRGLLDAQLEEIFGTSDLNSGMCLSQIVANVSKQILFTSAYPFRQQITCLVGLSACTLCCRKDFDTD
jgi:predicted membrane protein